MMQADSVIEQDRVEQERADNERLLADLLAGLCVNSTPALVLADRPSSPGERSGPAVCALYRRPHLPQGAPTSPALGNLAAYRLDCRLTGLAKAAGAQYTRYADDMAFSG